MSIAEMKAELARLSPSELVELEEAVRRAKAGLPVASAAPAPDMGQFVDSLAGVMKFGPGWDAPLPLEDWEALRDDPSA